MIDEDYSDGLYYTWPPFPDENKIDLVNNSSSTNLEFDYISKSLSEFSINPQKQPPPPQKETIKVEGQNKNSIENYFLSLIPPHKIYEANDIVNFYNYIVKPKKPLSTKSFGHLKSCTHKFVYCVQIDQFLKIQLISKELICSLIYLNLFFKMF